MKTWVSMIYYLMLIKQYEMFLLNWERLKTFLIYCDQFSSFEWTTNKLRPGFSLQKQK